MSETTTYLLCDAGGHRLLLAADGVLGVRATLADARTDLPAADVIDLAVELAAEPADRIIASAQETRSGAWIMLPPAPPGLVLGVASVVDLIALPREALVPIEGPRDDRIDRLSLQPILGRHAFRLCLDAIARRRTTRPESAAPEP